MPARTGPAGPADEDEPGTLAAGSVRYEVGPAISSGAMGAVHRGHDRVTGRPVAVKRLLDRRHAARFEIEARLLMRLRHPRVVPVLDVYEDDTGSHLVMELVSGMDLGRRLERHGDPGLPVAEALEHVRHAADALAYVHGQQVIHRDVKPRNLVLGREGVVLVDFGVARALDDPGVGTVLVGTPRYIAPEVLEGERASPRSDVYSLGATLWALLTGGPPTYRDPTALSRVVPDVSPDLEAAIRGALEPSPAHRTPSVEALSRALGAPVVGGGGSLALSVERPAAPRGVLEAVVRTVASAFEAAAASVALVDPADGGLVYQAAWGAGADAVVGTRLGRGEGLAGAALATGEALAVPACRTDPRFAARVAAGTGYVPHTMLVVPFGNDGGKLAGVVSILDRRDGRPYEPADIPRARTFADLVLTVLASHRVG